MGLWKKIGLTALAIWGFAVVLTLATNSGVNTRVVSTVPVPGCTVSDIGVDKLNARRQYENYIKITGRLTNNCAQATGVQVKVTSYDKAGNILGASDIWPASVSNIPGNSEYPFEWLDDLPGFARFEVSVIAVHPWR